MCYIYALKIQEAILVLRRLLWCDNHISVKMDCAKGFHVDAVLCWILFEEKSGKSAFFGKLGGCLIKIDEFGFLYKNWTFNKVFNNLP